MADKPKSLRISLEHGVNRRNKIEAAADLFDCGKSRAVLKCVDYTLKMAGDNLAEPNGRLPDAIDHPDMTPALAAVLSTDEIEVRYDVTADVEIHSE